MYRRTESTWQFIDSLQPRTPSRLGGRSGLRGSGRKEVPLGQSGRSLLWHCRHRAVWGCGPAQPVALGGETGEELDLTVSPCTDPPPHHGPALAESDSGHFSLDKDERSQKTDTILI